MQVLTFDQTGDLLFAGIESLQNIFVDLWCLRLVNLFFYAMVILVDDFNLLLLRAHVRRLRVAFVVEGVLFRGNRIKRRFS